MSRRQIDDFYSKQRNVIQPMRDLSMFTDLLKKEDKIVSQPKLDEPICWIDLGVLVGATHSTTTHTHNHTLFIFRNTGISIDLFLDQKIRISFMAYTRIITLMS